MKRLFTVIGERIGNFRIVSRLGAGGMGEVFVAEQEQIHTKVAIKMLLPHVSAHKEYVQRFFNEAIASSKIQHAGVTKIFDVGFHGERAYLVMEYLEGETLAARIHRLGQLPIDQVSDIGRQIAGVLDAVHKAGITHRDLKPDNVFIIPDAELASGERVKILDFGIAKLTGASGMGLTNTSVSSMGTPHYMSPEQWKSSAKVDWRADAYSFGCVAFEMISGKPPFHAESIGEACAKHLTEAPPRLSTLVAVPAELDAIVDRLLAKNPDERPPSMKEVANTFALAANAPLGLAPTLLPMSAVHPVASPTASPGTRPAALPPTTTLGAAASSVDLLPRKQRSVLPWIVALVGIVVAGAIAIVVVTRDDKPSSEASLAQNDPAPAPSPPGPSPAPAPAPTPAPPTPGSATTDAAIAIANEPTKPEPAKPEPAKPEPSKPDPDKKPPPKPHPKNLPERLVPQMVAASILLIRSRITECANTADRGGLVVIRTDVSPDGTPKTKVVRTPDPALGECVASAINAAKFPQTQQGGTFKYPFKIVAPPRDDAPLRRRPGR